METTPGLSASGGSFTAGGRDQVAGVAGTRAHLVPQSLSKALRGQQPWVKRPHSCHRAAVHRPPGAPGPASPRPQTGSTWWAAPRAAGRQGRALISHHCGLPAPPAHLPCGQQAGSFGTERLRRSLKSREQVGTGSQRGEKHSKYFGLNSVRVLLRLAGPARLSDGANEPGAKWGSPEKPWPAHLIPPQGGAAGLGPGVCGRLGRGKSSLRRLGPLGTGQPVGQANKWVDLPAGLGALAGRGGAHSSSGWASSFPEAWGQ